MSILRRCTVTTKKESYQWRSIAIEFSQKITREKPLQDQRRRCAESDPNAAMQTHCVSRWEWAEGVKEAKEGIGKIKNDRRMDRIGIGSHPMRMEKHYHWIFSGYLERSSSRFWFSGSNQAKIMKEAMAFYRILLLSYADREALLLNCGPLNCGSNWALIPWRSITIEFQQIYVHAFGSFYR